MLLTYVLSQSWLFHHFLLCWTGSLRFMLSALRLTCCWSCSHLWGLNHWGLYHGSLWPMAGICLKLVMVISPQLWMHWVASSCDCLCATGILHFSSWAVYHGHSDYEVEHTALQCLGQRVTWWFLPSTTWPLGTAVVFCSSAHCHPVPPAATSWVSDASFRPSAHYGMWSSTGKFLFHELSLHTDLWSMYWCLFSHVWWVHAFRCQHAGCHYSPGTRVLSTTEVLDHCSMLLEFDLWHWIHILTDYFRDTGNGHIFRWAWCHYIFSLFWVSSVQLVLCLILLKGSLLLASGLINYGARLGPFFHLCFWPPRYDHLYWFCYFSNHLAVLWMLVFYTNW